MLKEEKEILANKDLDEAKLNLANEEGSKEAKDYFLIGHYLSKQENYSTRVLNYLKKSANLGYARAIISLADYYMYEIKDNISEAIKMLEDLAKTNTQAIVSLFNYYNSIDDKENKFKWSLEGAKRGISEAMYELYEIYTYGRGVKKDNVEAFKWLKEASRDINNRNAHLHLGYCYLGGYEVPSDFTKAKNNLGLAGILHYEDVRNSLGLLANEDTYDYDPCLASYWFFEASMFNPYDVDFQNYDLSEVELGKNYLFGKGVIKNKKEALKWFRRAYITSEFKNKEARYYINQVSKELDESYYQDDKPIGRALKNYDEKEYFDSIDYQDEIALEDKNYVKELFDDASKMDVLHHASRMLELAKVKFVPAMYELAYYYYNVEDEADSMNKSNYWFNKASISIKDSNDKEYQELFDKFSKLNDDFSYAYIGDYYMMKNDLAKAKDYYLKGINYLPSKYNLAMLEKEDNLALAKKYLEEIVKDNDKFLPALYELASIIESEGNLEEALDLYEKAAGELELTDYPTRRYLPSLLRLARYYENIDSEKSNAYYLYASFYHSDEAAKWLEEHEVSENSYIESFGIKEDDTEYNEAYSELVDDAYNYMTLSERYKKEFFTDSSFDEDEEFYYDYEDDYLDFDGFDEEDYDDEDNLDN